MGLLATLVKAALGALFGSLFAALAERRRDGALERLGYQTRRAEDAEATVREISDVAQLRARWRALSDDDRRRLSERL